MRVTLLIFPLILFLNTANGFFIEAIIEEISISSLFSAGKFIYDLLSQINKEPEKIDPAIVKLHLIYPDITAENKRLLKAIEDSWEISNLIKKRKELYDNFLIIEGGFNVALRKYKSIMHGQIEHKARYKDFRADYENKMDTAMTDIRNQLTINESSSFLAKDFKTSLMKFENVCRTGMSGAQLMYNLYQKYIIAAGKYFVTKNLIYAFQEVFLNHSMEVSREILYDTEKLALKDSILKIKQFISEASLDVYRCNSSEGTYDQLPVFQKYYKRHVHMSSVGRIKKKSPKCELLTKTDPNECDDEDGSPPCLNARACSNMLYCRDMFTDENSRSKESPNSTVICVNDDTTAKSRYLSVQLYVDRFNSSIQCPEKSTRADVKWTHDIFSYVDPCDCICEEEKYFVDSSLVLANVSANKVVTGAKLTVKENVLFLQIQEGELVESGRINRDSIQWVPKFEDLKSKPETNIPITWDGFKEFSLLDTMLEPDRIITGLKFDTTFKNTDYHNKKRIGITTLSTKFDFNSGKLQKVEEEFYKIHFPEFSSNNELNLNDLDVPTKYNLLDRTDNKFDSKNASHLTMTITDLVKDGGQTTIPFIDVQEVSTNPLIPLSGIGLYHKGQPGYGGYMGIKLLTYDFASQINENFEFDKKYMIESVKKLTEFVNKGGISHLREENIPTVELLQ